LNKKTLSLFAVSLLVAFSAQAVVTRTDNAALAIAPDNGCTDDANGTGLGGLTRTIIFTEVGTISDANVSIDITHTWRADVQAGLSYSVGGGTIVLANNHDTSGDNYLATFDSGAAALCSANSATTCGATNTTGACATTVAVCQPNASLNAYNGLTSPGTWTLTLCDRAAADTGTLNSWAMTLDGDGELPVELMEFSIE